ncbi:DUF1000-domain-containing protein [Pluteus cervinus]|uniref:DUF1000-domain-containing protein n=1 Tax=Pluteus cervinus TaxID=181527 RepID=A0ACD3B359_9AGAR|nr:DUF1000-domain-containing protein [Pluteus cervinus]
MTTNPSDSSVASALADLDPANLYSLIDKQNTHGLNLSDPEGARSVIKPWNEREDTVKFVDSSVDDQMVIHVPFVETVRLRSIMLKVGSGEYAPGRLRVFANHPTIVDFSDAESIRPQLDLQLLEGETKVADYPLRVAAFASVNSVSLHFSDAPSGEISRVYYIGFKGDPRSLGREVNSKIEVPAPNAADKPLVDKVGEKKGAPQDVAR